MEHGHASDRGHYEGGTSHDEQGGTCFLQTLTQCPEIKIQQKYRGDILCYCKRVQWAILCTLLHTHKKKEMGTPKELL